MSQFQRPPFQQPPQQPPFYTQPEMYQQPGPPPVPPRKQRERKETFVAISIILTILIILGAIGVFAYASASANKNIAGTTNQATQAPTSAPLPTATLAPTPTEAPTQPPTPTPTPNPHGDIGISLSTGTWIVTLNNVYTSTGDEFDTPKTGNIYIVVDITALNNIATSQLLSSGANFVFQDQTGQAYDESITEIGKPPDGTVPANTKLRGQLVYEVSKTLHIFTLTFQDDSYPANSITWNIKE